MIFVVHEHAASRHHFDFRLEMDGVLKSWAVPGGIPETAGVRKLAVEVPDHDLAYADFEGEIPEGEYGAGTVSIWDRGTYRLLKRLPDRIEVELHGRRLNGRYLLILFKEEGRRRNWLFFRKKDDAAAKDS